MHMKRLHVHVAVDNLADSIRFYSGMFASEPAVLKEDYAKWMLDDPRVNFAISQRGREAGVNHLGIQVEDPAELKEMEGRLRTLQTPMLPEEKAACCYATSDKYWVKDPSGIAWETFHTLDSIPVYGEQAQPANCCVPLPPSAKAADACCVPNQAKAGKSACC
jgi:catechol 2,3-dioxygenase-like lactoylglutathione lyase family enzyme